MTNIHHPSPVNQFYRLEKDSPTGPWVKAERWNHRHVINGIIRNFDGVLCMAAAGAVALDAHTGGAFRTSPGRLHDFQDDRSGGIGVTDVRLAWSRGWGKTLYVPDFYDWNDLMYAVKVQRRHAIIGVDYRQVPYDLQVQKNGDFDHAINVDDFRGSDSRILRYDSLDTKAVWTPQSGYRAAAEALALRVRGSRGRLFVGLTAPRPLLGTTWHAVVQRGGGSFVRYFVSGTGANSRVTNSTREHTNTGFDVRCTAPVPVLRKSADIKVPLVQIINPGRGYDQWWISDDWARSTT